MNLGLSALLRAGLLAASSVCLATAATCAEGARGNAQFKEVQVATQAFSLAEPAPAWVDTVALPEPHQVQPVVLRLADTQYRVDHASVVYVRRALQINDAASLSSAGQISIAFVPQYHQLKLHEVRVHRGGENLDRTTSSAIRFLQRETGLERGIYSGEVTASVLVNDLRVGDTLEYSYSRHGQNPVFQDKFADMAAWDQPLPTSLRRVTLSHPVGREIAWRVIGDRQVKALAPRESTQNGMRQLAFEERAMGKVEVEALTPPDYVAFRWIQFSEFAGWPGVAAWASELFQSNDALDPGLAEIVEGLRKRATDEERVVGALEFVQSEIRYFSVSMGESSHRPTQPDLVLARRYGDCKDKSLLLITILRALGIQSRPVLLDIGRRDGLDKELPSPQLFNHAIVQVMLNGTAYYLDPTWLGQHGRLRSMGQLHAGSQVLVVAPDSNRLSRIADTSQRELLLSEAFETVSLPKFDADGELRTRLVWRGAAAEALRVRHERVPREQIVKSIGDAMEARYPGAKLIGDPDIQDDRANNVVSISAVYSAPKLALERDGNWFVRFLPGNMRGTLPAPPTATRSAPLYLPVFPYEARYTFEVTFPEQVSVMTDPHASSVKNKHFTYMVTSSFRGNVAKRAIELRVLAKQVEVADLQKYAEDVRSISNISPSVIAVPKGSIKSLSAKAPAKKDLAQTVRQRLEDTVAKTTEAIKSGKLSGADLAGSYCLRAMANSDLDKLAAGLADANEAMKIDPNSASSLNCRAYVQFAAADFDKSVADYSKAVALGGTDDKTLHQRGIARFYAGKLEEAAEDFLKASEGTDKEQQVFNDLWLTWTHQRLGKPVPASVIERAAAGRNGDWPRPALAVQTGNITPEELLRLLERKSGDDRKMASAEGYFYLGQYYLGRGDKPKAREYFERSRQLGIILYTEHRTAGFELRRLNAVTETGALPQAPPGAPQDARAGAKPPSPPSPDAKKTTGKPPRKAPEAWNSELWKRQ